MQAFTATIFLLLVYIASLPFAAAQTIKITGRVINSITRQPVENATLRSGKAHAITNKNGEFVLQQHTQLLIQQGISCSSVGYLTQTTFYKHVNTAIIIELTEGINNLPEVVIRNEANSIIKKAIERIPVNYPSRPFIMNGLLRLKRNQDNGYIYQNDAAVAIYTWPYSKKRQGEVKLIANQATINTATDYNPYSTMAWKTVYSLAPKYDFVHNRTDFADIDRLRQYSYTLLGKTVYANHRCFEIDVASKAGAKGVNYDKLEGRLYIDTSDYAFVAGAFTYVNVEPLLYIAMDTVHLEVEYQKGSHSWTLLSVKRDVRYAKHQKIHSTSSAEFTTTSLDTVNVEKFGYKEVIQSADDVQQTNVTTDSTLWQTYVQQFREAEANGYIRPAEPVNSDSLQRQKARSDSVGSGKLATLLRFIQTRYTYGVALAHAPLQVHPPVKPLSAYMAGLAFNIHLYRPLYFHLTTVSNFGVGGANMNMTTYALSPHITANRTGAPFSVNPIAGLNTFSVKYTDPASKKWKVNTHLWFIGLECSQEISRKLRVFAAGWYHFSAGNTQALNNLPIQTQKMAWTAGALLSR
ncbi:hypothetical protein HNQ91_000612 [Filimonas zeae]|uniref:Carboxypeptidase-like regulatory domain-containing protein n=1 Tax=Filimonas zeae TaxID=1737353 RepID=A0A917IQ95_9BACT|nr:hypothetical protein [Filimonas zeae]MDR6337590.1 hypothetical protein [Filimonas zeae]GGH59350.1 hypothetical protein GCM10011379_06020 [Filimonas zeae]